MKRKAPRVSVIVPAYNEEATLKAVLEKLLAHKDVFEVVVVDDASNDRTHKVARSVKHKKLTVLRHTKNRGKGGAIRTGLHHIHGEYVFIQDADLEYDPKELHYLLAPIVEGRADIVYGSRFFGAHTNMFYWHYLGNKFLNFVINVLYNTTLSDMETCYKLIPTKIMKELDLQENDFRIEPEITCKLLRRGHKIFEVPITYVGRTYAEGKKITWKDGLKAIGLILKLRFLQ